MDGKQRNYVETIRKEYQTDVRDEDKFLTLKRMERKVRMPVQLLGIAIGILGILLLGLGLSFVLGSLGDHLLLGTVLGCLGLVALLVNYPLTRFLLERRKRRYGKEILSLTEELLGSKD